MRIMDIGVLMDHIQMMKLFIGKEISQISLVFLI